MSQLLIRRLRLSGPVRNYDVDFTSEDGSVRPMTVIAGEISTGKTSILQFIAYSLGGNVFPKHAEIRAAVSVTLAEIEIDHVTFVIERSCVERPSLLARVHSCGLDAISGPHHVAEFRVGSATDEESLSHFLLRPFGISEVDLKEAPTQSASGVDRMSIRDLLRLIFVRYEDLGSENLLRENQPYVRLKYEQVIDVLFGAHDNRAASIASSIKSIQRDIEVGQQRLDTILTFMAEQLVPDRSVLEAQLLALDAEEARSERLLREIEGPMLAAANFGEQQRAAHLEASGVANSAANQRRTLATQIERLTALAAQYDQDIKKLTFARSANALFDPLLVSVCPWCFQSVSTTDGESDNCVVCHQQIADAGSADSGLDIDRELRAIKKRQGELADYLDDLHSDAAAVEEALSAATQLARRSQAALDSSMRSRFAPYLDQRDALIASMAALTQDREQVTRQLSMHHNAGRRRAELGQLRQRLAELSLALAEAETTSRTRSDAVAALTDRYVAVLEAFRFPKLSDAYIDRRYVPHARQLLYYELGSAGARTLVTLAWYLAIFEVAMEQGGPHPGLMLIDGPQKGLKPAAGQAADEFQTPTIADSVYQHLIGWSRSQRGSRTQLIVVDNAPPAVAEPLVVVRYSADAGDPPYGLIDDATT